MILARSAKFVPLSRSMVRRAAKGRGRLVDLGSSSSAASGKYPSFSVMLLGRNSNNNIHYPISHCYYSLQSERDSSSQTNSMASATPSYSLYGETAAFTVKAILPDFRVVSAGKTIVLDQKNRGRLLLEWVERSPNGKFLWDRPIRFALSAEEIGLWLFNAKRDQGSEFYRTIRDYNNYIYNNSNMPMVDVPSSSSSSDTNASFQKVFRIIPKGPPSSPTVQLVIDYELDGTGGQESLTANEPKGPLEVTLMIGEYHVLQSIMEYSIPRLIGWAPMMDHSLQQIFPTTTNPSTSYNNNYYNNTNQSNTSMKNPHNYYKGVKGDGGQFGNNVPF